MRRASVLPYSEKHWMRALLPFGAAVHGDTLRRMRLAGNGRRLHSDELTILAEARP
jgi:hypothetical protein